MKNYIIILTLVCFGFVAKDLTFAEDLSNQATVKTHESASKEVSKEDKENKKPLVVLEWEKVWGDLWQKEAKELKAQGLSDEKIINKLNPEAAKRVAKNLGIEKPEDVQKAVSECYTSLEKSKSQSR